MLLLLSLYLPHEFLGVDLLPHVLLQPVLGDERRLLRGRHGRHDVQQGVAERHETGLFDGGHVDADNTLDALADEVDDIDVADAVVVVDGVDAVAAVQRPYIFLVLS